MPKAVIKHYKMTVVSFLSLLHLFFPQGAYVAELYICVEGLFIWFWNIIMITEFKFLGWGGSVHFVVVHFF